MRSLLELLALRKRSKRSGLEVMGSWVRRDCLGHALAYGKAYWPEEKHEGEAFDARFARRDGARDYVWE
jgi:hypothetical protein